MSSAAGRIGRETKPPPQFGQIPSKIVATHRWQKVHSNEPIEDFSFPDPRPLTPSPFSGDLPLSIGWNRADQ